MTRELSLRRRFLDPVAILLFAIAAILSDRVFAQTPPVSPSPVASPSTDGQSGAITHLTAALPAFLESSKTFSATKEGILLPEHTYARTRRGDYLNRDFRLDLWLTIDPKLPTAFIGVGSGVDGPHTTPVNSIYIVIHPKGDISLATREGFGDEGIGNELDPGEYMVRVEKVGSAVTFSVGSQTANGEFEPDVTRTFADISKSPADFNDKNMHVFFGGGQYRQLQFTADGAMKKVPPGPDRTPQPAGSTAGLSTITRLSANLPPALECDGTFSVFSDRIVIPELTYFRTKKGDFLHQDFVLDLWLTIDPKKPTAFIGVGSGRNGSHAEPVNSIFMVVKPDGQIDMSTREGYGDEGIGKETDPGEYIVRLEKKGTVVTYSIGSEKDGQYQPDVTKTFADISRTPADFNDKNMHLFFGGGQYRQIRFTTSAETPAPQVPPRSAHDLHASASPWPRGAEHL